MLATVASVNSANRIRRKLMADHSVQAKIIQTPTSLTKEGCGYSLRFDDSYKNLVINTAKELKINIRSFFREEISQNTVNYIKE